MISYSITNNPYCHGISICSVLPGAFSHAAEIPASASGGFVPIRRDFHQERHTVPRRRGRPGR